MLKTGLFKVVKSWGSPGGPVLGLRAFTAVAGIQFLVGELRSCTLRGEAINK